MTEWRKASGCSAADTCVWVHIDDYEVRVANTPEFMGAKRFTYAEWDVFTAAVKAGEFDL